MKLDSRVEVASVVWKLRGPGFIGTASLDVC